LNWILFRRSNPKPTLSGRDPRIQKNFLLVDILELWQYVAVQADSHRTPQKGAERRKRGGETMAQDVAGQSMQSRVDRMFARDRLWAWAFVIVLWIVLAFVYFAVSSIIVDGTAKIVAAIAAILVGVFNTASIAAMISHYGHDKKFIYELDIRHLDANR
jgi:hypothetical protein